MRSLFLIAALLLFQPHAFAQQQEWWQDGCDPRAIALIQPVQGVFDYAGTCETYRVCDPNNEGVPICQLVAWDALLDSCAPEDSHCRDSATLFAAAIQTFDTPFVESVEEIPAQPVIENVPRALAAFQAGDSPAALEALQQIPPDYFTPMLPFSRGIVHTTLGNPDAALAAYDEALTMMVNVPLVYYARAQLYGNLGRLAEASFDAEWLRQYVQGHPELEALVAPLVAAYPLDATRLQDWLYYPLISRSMGPGGDFFTDLTRDEPKPIRLAFYDELNILLALGLNPAFREEGAPFADLVLLDRDGENYHYRRADEMFEAGLGVDLIALDNVFVGHSDLYFFEGSLPLDYLLAPAGAPDPRLALHGERCGIISRLRPGMAVMSAWYGVQGMSAYDAPDGNLLGEWSNAVVLDERVCDDGKLWWQVRADDGTVAWSPENEGRDYLMNPAARDETSNANRQLIPLYCPGTPAPRLAVGIEGRITAGSANNVRTAPDAEADLMGQIPPEAAFRVLDGPVCTDGFVWWQIQRSGGVPGWTAEGQGQTYWLEPVLER